MINVQRELQESHKLIAVVPDRTDRKSVVVTLIRYPCVLLGATVVSGITEARQYRPSLRDAPSVVMDEEETGEKAFEIQR